MTSIYLAALGFGATLLLVTLIFGGKDLDHHGGSTHELDGDHGFDWAPILSLRFWTFVMAFGGGIGFALTQLGAVHSHWVILAIALLTSWAIGTAVVAILRAVDKRSVSSTIAGAELVGSTATVTVAIAVGRGGKIRLDVKGRTIDAFAETEDDGVLSIGSRVLIVQAMVGGRLMVSPVEM